MREYINYNDWMKSSSSCEYSYQINDQFDIVVEFKSKIKVIDHDNDKAFDESLY
jgi:hypothetical protein